ncbi:hypothetical protein HDV00_006342 [Rhizophlyctis rosea]|nr:hypothetical protein HDV00_006342 [Rhizophlyctis rosea]
MVKLSTLLAGVACSIGLVSAQQSTQWCSPTSSLCYSSFTDANSGITTRVTLPAVTQADEFALQLIGSRSVGWVGASVTGSMRYSLLVVAWPDNGKIVTSARYATDYVMPTPLSGPVLTVLSDSVINSTHFVASIRCQNCGSWKDINGDTQRFQSSGVGIFGYAMSGTPVNQPSNPATTFNVHTTFNIWGMNMDTGRDSGYSTKITRLMPSTTTTTTTTRTTTTTTSTATPTSCTPPNPINALNVPSGWSAGSVLRGLTNPRGIAIDSAGHLLVVQSGVGLFGYTLSSNNCALVTKTIISKSALNHGVALSPDGKTLYVSSPDSAWRYSYDAATMTATNEQVVVKNMGNNPADHITRTIQTFVKNPDLIAVNRGSAGNIDDAAYSTATARAAVKIFDMSSVPSGGYDYATGGRFAGYGLRNEVGLVEDGAGNLWGVENSADNLVRRSGSTDTDVHIDNPGEKLNFLGNPANPTGSWYGYPYCFTIWDPSTFPKDQTYSVGQQFVQRPNNTINDSTCSRITAPSLQFQPHSAPLDIKFSPVTSDTNAYVSFHGSWNRQPPTGYKVVAVPGRRTSAGGWEPTGTAASKEDGYTDLLWNTDATQCASGGCFRPVGLVWDSTGTKLFVSSDSSGEVFVLTKRGGTTTTTTTTRTTTTTTTTRTTTTAGSCGTVTVPGTTVTRTVTPAPVTV